ncbi:FAD-dependent oxidoreductase [Roseobacter sp. HKCCD9010]|uniref:NAD(P)/FAD-dependent oxidoreductase n=1 Tax=unclassified Roseobacter TaxID=196798 RepID=UPI001492B839|nr:MULTISPECIES: FAD-dependent oxidoreductase [unclassified Roseobacter]MBF9051071.1 FAD-dependent oxidoreductase [Rhodobacterales bacterium HKCCD4356]NNV12840.1 FAD-dependent oxidoreductase [Roseobacter sp. HKCCD7357]NNV16785.1 FAD-dependent oxidoreductase [Roseobacter sp. HKCCD8768]NNV26583.1 FAD-dependent oxidoreductase [Roseobacter sp. HKCCD8192]NNV30506.1 FAD-dependent oxidoreductase [Roseobacter sp. HKCCD9061]
MSHIVVVGAGQAGAALAAKLRSEGFGGQITLIGEEHVPPYQRPPLSKAYLMGEMALERLYLRPESYYAENGIDLHLDETVNAIDRADKVVIAGGHQSKYDQLALTTGSVPRRLPGSIGGELRGVHVVRTLADVDAMAPEALEGRRVLIVGGGYIGLEAAAVCAKRGMQVTLIEMADRILQRVACPETSAYFGDLHRSRGVDIREGIGLARLTGESHVTGAALSDGAELPFDMVIVGIGISPATSLAEAAGLEIDNGIKVDALGQTSDPSIWSAGDCASFPFRGNRIRLESVQNAIDQAELVARNMMGAGEAYDPHPWFWSDQYDVKLQIAGLNTGYDRVVVRGAAPSVSHWYYAGERLLAVDAMNDPRAYMVGKRLLEAGKSPAADVIADTETDLKTLLRA